METKQELDGVVFDLGGVLIDWNPRYLYRKLFSDASEMEWFLTEVCSPAWNHKFDAGRPFEEGIQERVLAYPQYASQIRYWRDRWPETLGDSMGDTVAILEALKNQSCRLFALTNWSAETFHYAQAKFKFLSDFEHILVSGEEKLAKPDPQIYLRLLEKIHLPAHRLLFTDDVVANIEAAQKLGFETHRFLNAQGLQAALAKYRILSQDDREQERN